MLIKAINKDKVKILIEDKDIGLFPDIKNLDPDSEKSRALILKLLKEVHTRTGIDLLYGKVVIEAVSGTGGSYYLLITRVKDNDREADGDLYLFVACALENIIDAMRAFKTYENLTVSGSAIYSYKNKYYLAVEFPPSTVSDGKFYLLVKELCEHLEKCKWSILNEALLKEWGELIVQDPVFLSEQE